jgi:arylsulfatase A-like enzyme
MLGSRISIAALLLCSAGTMLAQGVPPPQRHNVIIFVADGLRRASVNEADMPTFLHLRTSGVDFKNSHSVYPTLTTANASAIATGHGLGDTGDYANVLYPGVWLSKPDPLAATGEILPFLESDDILADMNSVFANNYLGERTLLSEARDKGFNAASVGKLGPTAIQQIDSIGWSDLGFIDNHGAIVVDESTGPGVGIMLPGDVRDGIQKAGLMADSPTRSNGYGKGSQGDNGFTGDAQNAGTLSDNHTQQQWYVDVTTKVLLPKFAAENKPFVLLFWSRDPDGTQHNQGDSLQTLTPGINGETVARALHNVDHDLKQLLDWLDAHPAVKANTDVLVTSDHGFATISRREIAADGTLTGEPSAALTYDDAKGKTEPAGTLPAGFLAVDLGIRLHLRVYDPSVRATTGSSVYQEVQLSGEKSQHPANGSALLGETVQKIDGSDAQLLVASNAGSDLIYAPTGDTKTVRAAIATLMQLDYIAAVFVDDKYCPAEKDCPGALPLSAVGLVGKSKVPRPAIVVAFKDFLSTPGDLLSGKQVADTTLQEGQGNHGGFGRDQTYNNMAAIGPDFKAAFVDETPVGNMDIAPTLAHILGFELPSVGSLKGRVAVEALAVTSKTPPAEARTMLSAPTASGVRTLLEYQEVGNVRYYDRACQIKGEARHCD